MGKGGDACQGKFGRILQSVESKENLKYQREQSVIQVVGRLEKTRNWRISERVEVELEWTPRGESRLKSKKHLCSVTANFPIFRILGDYTSIIAKAEFEYFTFDLNQKTSLLLG